MPDRDSVGVGCVLRRDVVDGRPVGRLVAWKRGGAHRSCSSVPGLSGWIQRFAPGRDLTCREALSRGGRLLIATAGGQTAATWVGSGSSSARSASRNWHRLERSLRGSLLRPGDHGFRAANAAENYRYRSVVPAGIALCARPEDVQACVRWARENGVPLVARSGGHSFAGYSRTTGLQVDLRRMKSATVDLQSGTLRVTGAVRFSDLDAVLRPHNLLIPAGQCPPVGLNGFTLGGGFGFYSRTHGLAVDHLIRTEVVLATGDKVTADHSRHSDLFWACRGGGGGNFGINTSMEFSLFPVGRVSVCKCEWSTDLGNRPQQVPSAIRPCPKHLLIDRQDHPRGSNCSFERSHRDRSRPLFRSQQQASRHPRAGSVSGSDLAAPVLGSRLLESEGVPGRPPGTATVLR